MLPRVKSGIVALGIGILFGVSLAVGPAVLADKRESAKALPWEEARLLAEVLELVRRDYVDRIDDHDLIEAAIRGMIADLDPHSAFLGPEEYQDIRISTSGKYSGVGIEVSADDGRIVVVAPIEGGPAERAGVRSGDVIESVDGNSVEASQLEETVGRMRGPAGTRVVLGILRDGEDVPLSVEIWRGQIEVRSVRAEVLEPGYGYIRISHFSDTTVQDLGEAVRDLRAQFGQPLAGMVLDLRNNPGGVLDAAIAVADAFLDNGVIVSAEGRMPDARFRASATPGDLLAGAPLTVLVNGGSASASEIVAGALKDHRRATIVGTPTFGKGSVQTIMPLSEGRAIKLTTSRYYTPSGMPITATGVTPDLVVEARDAGEEDVQLTSALSSLKTRRLVLHDAR